jgi:hypothetical protein
LINKYKGAFLADSPFLLFEAAEIADCATVGRGRKGRVGLQRRGDVAAAGSSRLPAERVLLDTAGLQRSLVDSKLDGPVGDVDDDRVAFADQADGAAIGGFRRDVADRQARCATREAPVGDQRALLAEARDFR